MKTNGKTAPKRVTRRDLFAELSEGMTALAEARLGKRTLRTHAIK
ncbi:MAG TPA: hypothetical protein VN380_09595 [Thermoanaerobaculia bacterium]|jgi:hypothetical protein|nr:hypothetical protein [Thermoanaerobaculia bacterium]